MISPGSAVASWSEPEAVMESAGGDSRNDKHACSELGRAFQDADPEAGKSRPIMLVPGWRLYLRHPETIRAWRHPPSEMNPVLLHRVDDWTRGMLRGEAQEVEHTAAFVSCWIRHPVSGEPCWVNVWTCFAKDGSPRGVFFVKSNLPQVPEA